MEREDIGRSSCPVVELAFCVCCFNLHTSTHVIQAVDLRVSLVLLCAATSSQRTPLPIQLSQSLDFTNLQTPAVLPNPSNHKSTSINSIYPAIHSLQTTRTPHPEYPHTTTTTTITQQNQVTQKKQPPRTRISPQK